MADISEETLEIIDGTCQEIRKFLYGASKGIYASITVIWEDGQPPTLILKTKKEDAEQIEAENKKLKEGIETVKTEVQMWGEQADERKANSEYHRGVYNACESVMYVVDKYLGGKK